jgi:hypothetical protein
MYLMIWPMLFQEFTSLFSDLRYSTFLQSVKSKNRLLMLDLAKSSDISFKRQTIRAEFSKPKSICRFF